MPSEFILECAQEIFPLHGRGPGPGHGCETDIERFDEQYPTRAEAEVAGEMYESQGWDVLIQERIYTDYVNIYLVDQGYGGPEEGGWWFTHGTPHASIPVLGKETVEEVVDRYQPLVDQMNEGRYSISSVLSEGVYQIHHEKHQAKAFPHERPHYE
jgi:hypothetical protein